LLSFYFYIYFFCLHLHSCTFVIFCSVFLFHFPSFMPSFLLHSLIILF
jgi:hypothetical protein